MRYQGNGIPQVMVHKLGRISQQTEKTDVRSPSHADYGKQTLTNDGNFGNRLDSPEKGSLYERSVDNQMILRKNH